MRRHRPDSRPMHRQARRTLPRSSGPLLVAAAVLVLPATALAASSWGFGPGGQSSATIIWEPQGGQSVTEVVFTFPVKVRRAATRPGTRCKLRRHRRQVRCSITPATSYGYVDVVTRTRMPCGRALKFSVRPVGESRLTRQAAIPSANACS